LDELKLLHGAGTGQSYNSFSSKANAIPLLGKVRSIDQIPAASVDEWTLANKQMENMRVCDDSNIEQSEFEKWLTQIAATLLIKLAFDYPKTKLLSIFEYPNGRPKVPHPFKIYIYKF